MSLTKSVLPAMRSFSSLGKQNYESVSFLVANKALLQTSHRPMIVYGADQIQSMRMFHATKVNETMEDAVKTMGAGLSLVGVTGPGIGLGYVFGSLLNASARNPSLAQDLFTKAMIGGALCEGLGLFLIVVAFIIIM